MAGSLLNKFRRVNKLRTLAREKLNDADTAHKELRSKLHIHFQEKWVEKFEEIKFKLTLGDSWWLGWDGDDWSPEANLQLFQDSEIHFDGNNWFKYGNNLEVESVDPPIPLPELLEFIDTFNTVTGIKITLA